MKINLNYERLDFSQSHFLNLLYLIRYARSLRASSISVISKTNYRWREKVGIKNSLVFFINT